MKKTFYKFLKQQQYRDDPVGDLAQDVRSDSSLKTVKNSFDSWEMHLLNKRACDGAMKALKVAWKEYSKNV